MIKYNEKTTKKQWKNSERTVKEQAEPKRTKLSRFKQR